MKKGIIFFVMLAVFLVTSVPPAMARPQWFGPIHLDKDGNATEEDIAEIAKFSNFVLVENQAGSTDPVKMAVADIEKITLASEYNAKTVLVLLDIFFEGIWQTTFNFNADFYSVDSADNLIYENVNKVVATYDFSTGNLWGLDGHYMGWIVSNSDGAAVYTTERGAIISGTRGNRLVAIVPRSDFAERWWEYTQIIKPYAENIMGVVLLDEPYLRAIRQGTPLNEMRRNLNKMIALVKGTFPTMQTIGIFSTLFSELDREFFCSIPIPGGTSKGFGFPEFDVVGFDFYYSSNLWKKMTLEEFKFQWKKKFWIFRELLLPWQEIVLIPGTFYSKDADPPTVEEFLYLADFYHEIANYDSRATVIMPFLWKSVEKLDLIGMKDLPEEVLLRWQEIGREISRP